MIWWIIGVFVLGLIFGAVGLALIQNYLLSREFGRIFGWY